MEDALGEPLEPAGCADGIVNLLGKGAAWLFGGEEEGDDLSDESGLVESLRVTYHVLIDSRVRNLCPAESKGTRCL